MRDYNVEIEKHKLAIKNLELEQFKELIKDLPVVEGKYFKVEDRSYIKVLRDWGQQQQKTKPKFINVSCIIVDDHGLDVDGGINVRYSADVDTHYTVEDFLTGEITKKVFDDKLKFVMGQMLKHL